MQDLICRFYTDLSILFEKNIFANQLRFCCKVLNLLSNLEKEK